MKKKIAAVISTVLMIVLIAGTNVFAVRETIPLGANQVWNTRSAVARSTYYSYVAARCYAVYPPNGGNDNFTRVQVRAKNASGIVITSIVTLYETADTTTSIDIFEGYLNATSVTFQFRGNDPDYAATADVFYYGN